MAVEKAKNGSSGASSDQPFIRLRICCVRSRTNASGLASVASVDLSYW